MAEVKRKEGSISIWNNGAGLPVQAWVRMSRVNVQLSFWSNRQMHREHQCYVPELVFGLESKDGLKMILNLFWTYTVSIGAQRVSPRWGQLLTSDNYDDNEKKVVGGRNGAGSQPDKTQELAEATRRDPTLDVLPRMSQIEVEIWHWQIGILVHSWCFWP